MNLRDFQRDVHANASSKGFWDASSNVGEKIALIHAELSELLEAYREDPTAPCDKQGTGMSREEEEMADVLIRLLDLAEHRGIDLAEAAARKHAYNLTRPRMHGRAF